MENDEDGMRNLPLCHLSGTALSGGFQVLGMRLVPHSSVSEFGAAYWFCYRCAPRPEKWIVHVNNKPQQPPFPRPAAAWCVGGSCLVDVNNWFSRWHPSVSHFHQSAGEDILQLLIVPGSEHVTLLLKKAGDALTVNCLHLRSDFPGLSSSLLKLIWMYILLGCFFHLGWDRPMSFGELWFVISVIILSSQVTSDSKAEQVGDMVLEAMRQWPLGSSEHQIALTV